MNEKQRISVTEKIGLWTVVYIVMFAASAVFLIWKCRFGFGNNDESFYLTIPYRLYQGDSLFANEWHLSQMAGFLLLPFVSLYMAVFKSTTGIIMAFRYLFICVLGITSIAVFQKLKKYNPAGSAIAAVIFFLYAPFNINALSYNSMGIIFMTLCTVFFVSERNGKKYIVELLFSGLFFAAAVLCCPYLIIFYSLYTLCVFLFAIFSKFNKAEPYDEISVKTWIVFSVGIAILACVFMTFVLSRASLESVVDSFRPILNDPEHSEIGIGLKLFQFLYSIIFNNGLFSAVAYFMIAVLATVSLIDKKREKRRSLYMIVSALICGFLLFIFVYLRPYINYIMFPINAFAFECLILFWENKAVRNLFFKIWVPGIIYSFCIHMASNTCFFAISSAAVVSLCASVAISVIAVKENMKKKPDILKRIATLTVCCLLTLQVGFEVYLRYKLVFLENEGINAQVCPIEHGCEKGVVVTPEKRDLYYDFIEIKDYVISEYGENRAILFLSVNTWYYLAFENYTNSSYSAWLSGVNDASFERLEEYYKINPEKVPELIYIDSDYVNYIDSFKKNYSFKEEILKNNAVILSELSTK